MRVVAAVVVLSAGIGLVLAIAKERAESRTADARDHARAPISPGGAAPARTSPFVPNRGQWRGDARYRVQACDGEVSLAPAAFTLSSPDRRPRSGPTAGAAVRFAMAAAAPAQPRAEEQLPGVHHYFLGDDPARWHTHVPLYARVRYGSPWPGIDVVCYLLEGQFEYDLELAPGADLARAVFVVEGARRLALGADGSLAIDTAIGTLRQSPPRTFTVDANGARHPIEARCVLLGRDRFGFEVPGWDGDAALVLDPGLTWSTYLGGAANLDFVRGVHVDAAGVTTVVGNTGASDFPTTPGAWNRTYNVADCFISRLDPALAGAQQLLYSTFVGGSSTEIFHALAVSPSGVVTAVGHTFSHDFPHTNTWNYQPPSGDLVVARFDPSLAGAAQLRFSTPFGGLGGESALCVAIDALGRTALGGYTTSLDYPATANAFQSLLNGNGGSGAQDGLIAVLDATGGVTYSTYLGRTALDAVKRLVFDASGTITAAGDTNSTTFPTTAGAFDTTHNGAGSSDVFVVRLDPARAPAQQLLYSTFFGGAGADAANGLAVDGAGVVTFAGSTESSNLPTSAGAFDTSLGWNRDAFVARLDPARSGAQQLLYATYLGGSTASDAGGFLAVDGAGVITVAGITGSADFPTTPGAFDRTRGGQNAFVAQLDPAGSGANQLRYGTFLGGSALDEVFDLARHPSGSVTVVGQTTATDFPTTPGAYDTTYNGQQDGFLARLDLLPTGVRVFGMSSPGCEGSLAIGVNSWPQRGNAAFAFTCSGAPSSATGVLALSTAGLGAPIPVLGIGLWVDPFAAFFTTLPLTSTAGGGASAPLPLPNQAAAVGFRLSAQFVWAGPSAPPPCPPLGFSATSGLEITVQP